MIVRPYRRGDRAAVREICLATGDGGEPAHGILDEPDLMAHVFLDPYLLLQPELAFVAEVDGIVLGYVVAALDSAEFFARWQLEWAPRFCVSHPNTPHVVVTRADSLLRAFLHHPRLMLPSGLAAHPSHLHMSLLAGARRHGAGRALLRAEFAALARAGSPGVQLGVQDDNIGAQAFYEAAGMVRLPPDENAAVRYGRHLRSVA